MKNIPMDLLRTLATVADAGSVTRAAASLGRSQPAISLQMKRLEDIVGGSLFHWDGRRMSLTDSGETLLGYAIQIVGLNDEAIGRLARPRLEGHVTVGTPNDFAVTFLPQVLGRFTERYPGVTLEVSCDLSARLLSRFAAGRPGFDLILAMQAGRPVGRPAYQWTEELIWAAAPGDAAWKRRPLPLVVYPEGCIYRLRLTQALDAAGIPWRIVFCSASLAGLQAAVVSGLGITVLARSTVLQGLQSPEPAKALPALAPATIGLYQRPHRLASAAPTLAKFIAEAFGALQPGSLPSPGKRRRRTAAKKLIASGT
jgi:DNA-binding transcriptional LysR family regulator